MSDESIYDDYDGRVAPFLQHSMNPTLPQRMSPLNSPYLDFALSDCVRFGTALDVWHFILLVHGFEAFLFCRRIPDAVSEKRSVTRADQGA
jgi:hypothetical protein